MPYNYYESQGLYAAANKSQIGLFGTWNG
jgi:hypothetical protein